MWENVVRLLYNCKQHQHDASVSIYTKNVHQPWPLALKLYDFDGCRGGYKSTAFATCHADDGPCGPIRGGSGTGGDDAH